MLHQTTKNRLRPYSPISSHPSIATAKMGHLKLRQGSRGDGVSLIQQALIGVVSGLPLSTSGGTRRADGIFGPETLAAVQTFQISVGLAADGIIGPKTIAALDAATKRASISQLITGSELILKSVAGMGGAPTDLPLSVARRALMTALSPFDTDTWRHPDVPQRYFTSGAVASAGGAVASAGGAVASAGGTTMALRLPILANPVAIWLIVEVAVPVLEAAIVAGAVAVGAAMSQRPLPLVPKAPPTAVGISEAGLLVMLSAVKVHASFCMNMVKLWEKVIIDCNLNKDPKCQDAVQKAKIAVEELKQAALSAPHALGRIVSRAPGSLSRDFGKVMERLNGKLSKATKAVADMMQACPLSGGMPPPPAPG